jgi:hypothetical protein
MSIYERASRNFIEAEVLILKSRADSPQKSVVKKKRAKSSGAKTEQKPG